MSREDAITKLISIRHHCFRRGVLGHNGGRTGGDDDFRQAFRVVNRCYAELKHERPGAEPYSRGRRSGAVRRRAPQTCAGGAA